MKVPYTKSGKCGKVVWQRNRYGQICYEAFVPYNPRTPAQQAGRGVFAAVSARWRTLTQEQRDAWVTAAWNVWSKPRLGSGRLPGFNLFVKVSVPLANQGQSQLDLPPGYSQSPQPAGPTLRPVGHSRPERELASSRVRRTGLAVVSDLRQSRRLENVNRSKRISLGAAQSGFRLRTVPTDRGAGGVRL